MLGQHGIGGQPQAQALGQHLRLFDAGFGHEDDELIAAVASHHVRLAAFLLEQASDARQHQVAFEVPKVSFTSLNLSRSMSTTENGRPGAGSALPLRRERFPEEAPRLDSGQAVGNRLLLQFLEDEGVVQGGRQQVRQRAQDEHVLWRERVLFAALDVQHAEQRFAIGHRNAQYRARSGRMPSRCSSAGHSAPAPVRRFAPRAQRCRCPAECAFPWLEPSRRLRP